MAITDYASLQSEIADWSHRSDLATKIPTFIQLAEAKLSTQIRDRKLEVTLNDSIAAGGTYTLPEFCVPTKALYSPTPLYDCGLTVLSCVGVFVFNCSSAITF